MDWKKWGLICILLLLLWIWAEIPNNNLHVVFCDVGQGDAAVIVLGYFQVVMDTGAYDDKILDCLDKHIPFWDKKIELVFLSHSDKDHVGALGGIKKFYKIGKLIEKASVGDRFLYQSLYFDVVKGSENNINSPMQGSSESNEASIVLEMKYENFSALFTGDIDMENEKALVASGLLGDVDVLKVSHHGSKYSSGVEFLQKLRPKYGVISVGKKNTYGHPAPEVVERLLGVGTKVLRTDKMGTIEIVVDGDNLSLRAERGNP